MGPIDFEALSSALYRLPSRHPSAERRLRRLRDAGEELAADTASPPAATVPDAATEIKRRQEALMLSYLLHQPARY